MNLAEVDTIEGIQLEPIAGSNFNLEIDTVIIAIGEAPDIPARFGLKRVDGNRIWIAPKTLATNKKGVFACGDAVSGPTSIIEAIAEGRRAAISIDKYLGGTGDIKERLAPAKGEVRPLDAEELPEERRVPQTQAVPLAKRLFGFVVPEHGYTEAEAIKEANRCLRCDANFIYTVNDEKCQGCYNCRVVCPVEGCISMRTAG